MKGGYQAAINRIRRAALGAFQSTPTGIVAAESRLAPARALLNHRQPIFAQRLPAGPQWHRGLEEIMTRRSDLTGRRRLRVATALQPGETSEMGGGGALGLRLVASKEEEALRLAEKWGRRKTIWIGVSLS